MPGLLSACTLFSAASIPEVRVFDRQVQFRFGFPVADLLQPLPESAVGFNEISFCEVVD